MKTYKIFTSGKMGGLSYRQQMEWRREIEKQIRGQTIKPLTFIHPPMFYQYRDNEIEAMNWEMNHLIDSDIVIVNLENIANSIGTHMELGVVDAVNKALPKNIYVVGIGEPDTSHPWISNSLFHTEECIEDAAEYIVSHLLL